VISLIGLLAIGGVIILMVVVVIILVLRD